MLDGLHRKLLGNGLTECCPLRPLPVVVLVLSGEQNRSGRERVRRTNGFDGKLTPLESTVIAAPSSAPIRLGSCSSSARLPLRVASQPTVASSGKRSTWGLLSSALKPDQPAPQLCCQSLDAPR